MGKAINEVHGNCKRSGRTKEYRTWAHIKGRCFNPTDGKYYRYGGRGITMCATWREDFAKFLHDMGPAPSKSHSIDRINNEGNYEPGNCKWATTAEQNVNRSDNVKLSFQGETKTLSQWSKIVGMSPATLTMRHQRNLPIEMILYKGNLRYR